MNTTKKLKIKFLNEPLVNEEKGNDGESGCGLPTLKKFEAKSITRSSITELKSIDGVKPLFISNALSYYKPPAKKAKYLPCSKKTAHKAPRPIKAKRALEKIIVPPNEIPAGSNQFDKLSDEMILQIFSWLPKVSLAKCAQVCKRWRTLSYDESLWKYVHMARTHVAPGVIEIIITRGAVALRLAMTQIKHCSTSSWWWSIPTDLSEPRFSKLQYLDFTQAMVSVTDLVQILGVCNKLSKISLEKCLIDDDVCNQLAANSNLQELNMCMCIGLTATGIGVISLCCLKLKSWNLAWTKLEADSLLILGKNLPTDLDKLNISGCRANLSDEGLALIINRCLNLTELDISDSSLLTGLSINNIVNNLTQLEHLCCSRCYSIKPVSYLLLRKLSHLQRLELFYNMSGTALNFIKQGLSNVYINQEKFSTIARPTTGIKRTSIWGIRVRDT